MKQTEPPLRLAEGDLAVLRSIQSDASRTVRELALEVLAIAKAGLQRRNRLDSIGADESAFLTILQDIADSGRSPADRKLALFHEEWGGQIDPIYEEFAY